MTLARPISDVGQKVEVILMVLACTQNIKRTQSQNGVRTQNRKCTQNVLNLVQLISKTYSL